MEYNHILENAFRLASDADQKLQMVVAILQKEDIVRKLIAIVSFQFFLYINLFEKKKIRFVPFNTSDHCCRHRRLAMLSHSRAFEVWA